MTLWEDKISSAQLWRPNETILLVTNPKLVAHSNKLRPMPPRIGLDYSSLVDVDPEFSDATWLRDWVANRVKQEAVYIPFPEGIWDAKEAVNGPVRALFTLAEVDEFARSDPPTDFTGKLSLIILGMDLLNLYREKKICCIVCCGVPLYANQPTATCKNCIKQQRLVPNPRIMGTLADETGCIAQGKLIWIW
ncbi:hypothetical protein C8035_v010550 [Colletotrichum spinosum]|uniref:Uncharacterized protein n=1 Tax=Colletotrichum spinosum TaxID=1347390 RepID=A0A4R8PNX8_9PEZI|nr:hypothetical protein C8035_v010550 [Colletotrichum spinosum]